MCKQCLSMAGLRLYRHDEIQDIFNRTTFILSNTPSDFVKIRAPSIEMVTTVLEFMWSTCRWQKVKRQLYLGHFKITFILWWMKTFLKGHLHNQIDHACCTHILSSIKCLSPTLNSLLDIFTISITTIFRV